MIPMLKRRIFLAAVIMSALMLSACAENDIPDISETEVTDPPDVLQTTVSDPREWSPGQFISPPVDDNTTTTKVLDDEVFVANYFNEHGFRYSDYTVYVDMDKFPDTDDPFENISKDYADHAHNLVLYNADGRDISFLNNISAFYITIVDYSGKCDFSNIDKYIYFDNYMGGDISTIIDDTLYFVNYKGGYDLSAIADMQNIFRIEFDGYSSEDDLEFIRECKNLTSLWLENENIDCEKIADILKDSNINNLFMQTDIYRSSDMDMLAKAFPETDIIYRMNDSAWNYENYPTEGLVFYPNLYIDGNESRGETDEEFHMFASNSWLDTSELVNVFSNFTDETQTVNSLEIYRDNGGELTEIPFSDGNTSFNVNIEITPKTDYDLVIPKDIFPYDKCETGIYKIEFETSYGTLSSKFFIDNTNGLDFLTDEQKEIFDKAKEITSSYFGCSYYLSEEYAAEHTVEEFLAPIREAYTDDYAYSKALGMYIDENGELAATLADRGSDITLQYVCFAPVYSDDNEVTFKFISIHGHEDYPYFSWYEERNFHMVKTENGWRFDKFPTWY